MAKIHISDLRRYVSRVRSLLVDSSGKPISNPISMIGKNFPIEEEGHSVVFPRIGNAYRSVQLRYITPEHPLIDPVFSSRVSLRFDYSDVILKSTGPVENFHPMGEDKYGNLKQEKVFISHGNPLESLLKALEKI